MGFNKPRILKTVPILSLGTTLYIILLNYPRKNCPSKGKLELNHLLKQDVGELQACSAIIQGDMDGVDKDVFRKLLAFKKRKSLLSESFYLNATKDCPSYIQDRGFLTISLCKEENDFPIAYSMVVHEKIEMFERLLRAVYNPHNVYCVHVDQKSPEIFREAVRVITSYLTNVFVASKLENVIYASWSRVQADINCMQDLLKSPVQWKYLLNTCGSDFPIKTNAEMVQSLKYLNGKNSLESENVEGKKGHWQYHHDVTNIVTRTDVKKSPPPIETPMFSRNAYFVVSREFVEHIFKCKEIQNFMEWEKDTYSPDEHIWATLQRMPSVPGSNPPNIKYEQSDMNSIAVLCCAARAPLRRCASRAPSSACSLPAPSSAPAGSVQLSSAPAGSVQLSSAPAGSVQLTRAPAGSVQLSSAPAGSVRLPRAPSDHTSRSPP